MPKKLNVTVGGQTIDVILRVTAYMVPFCEPPRLMVHLDTADPNNRFGPHYTILSVNLPNVPPPEARQFFVKTWSENEGLLEQLVSQGALRVVDPVGVPVNAWGSKAVVAELALDDADMVMEVPDAATRQRMGDDQDRFMSSTYIMHLGM
mmetsp:Transcript_26904/g.58732  ORF Transcript_26904/g.58732 Transcript_26904/m.58732 type:complete len:150 (+) Transcript_26904:118-567(+)|eukprot:CAMPEP_0202891692 /NCGR_PEP_ID=MMETSP1392-20130828/1691_1 /ASSEMBLY_ACC=CAM_ASM_000868 /TAXON_ID=225041 /ORGANISM="Chlamydomonas chlamydogama, Strain SAG 11-48b" /LENGTH=149 /DNA_ID=CAMNT_0049575519 /DNA_START=115 /DNA_END=564 /DNA_ORIENTATION=+